MGATYQIVRGVFPLFGSVLAAVMGLTPLPALSADPSLSDEEVQTPCGTTQQIPGAGERGKEGCSGNLMVPLSIGPLTLYYNSQYSRYNPTDNPRRPPPWYGFGRGWTAFPELVRQNNNALTIRWSDGSTTEYIPANRDIWVSKLRVLGDTSIIRLTTLGYELRFQPGNEKLIFNEKNARLVPVRQVSSDGLKTDYYYDPSTLAQGGPPIPSRITDLATGKSISLTLSADKYVVTQITDDDGLIYNLSYSGDGPNSRLDTITLPDRSSYRLAYDTDGRGYLTSVKDPFGQYTFYSFFKHGRLKAVGRSSGDIFSYTYTNTSITIQRYSSSNVALQFQKTVFDRFGYATEFRSGDGAPSAAAPGVLISALSYDPIGRVTSSTDELGDVVNFYYNADGSCSSSDTTPGTSPLPTCIVSNGNQTVISRDTSNLPTKMVRRDSSRNEVTMDISWDGDRIKTKEVKDVQGRTTLSKSVAYDGVFPTQVNLKTTTYFDAYDDLGRIVRMTGSSGIARSYGYDQNGYTNSTDVGGMRTTMSRNIQPDGSVVMSVSGPGGQRSFTSNLLGNQRASTLAPRSGATVPFSLSVQSKIDPGIGTQRITTTTRVTSSGGKVASQFDSTSTLDGKGGSSSNEESRLNIN